MLCYNPCMASNAVFTDVPTAIEDIRAGRMVVVVDDDEAIREARRITSRGGGLRQRQYIGKLMRDVDLEPIRAALSARSALDAQETERFKRAEAWRDRLISEGLKALDDLERWRPGLDRTEWTRRISAAQTERARSGVNGAAGRDLFRAFRALFDTIPR